MYGTINIKHFICYQYVRNNEHQKQYTVASVFISCFSSVTSHSLFLHFRRHYLYLICNPFPLQKVLVYILCVLYTAQSLKVTAQIKRAKVSLFEFVGKT
jgi:hypothetical protein